MCAFFHAKQVGKKLYIAEKMSRSPLQQSILKAFNFLNGRASANIVICIYC